MPFEVVSTVSGRQNETQATISYRKIITKSGRAKLPRLIIGIPAAVVNGGGKLKANATFALKVGTGADKGKARILPAPEGVTARLLKGGITFRFGYLPMLGTDQAEREFVEARSIDGGFEIDLPAWFKAEGE